MTLFFFFSPELPLVTLRGFVHTHVCMEFYIHRYWKIASFVFYEDFLSCTFRIRGAPYRQFTQLKRKTKKKQKKLWKCVHYDCFSFTVSLTRNELFEFKKFNTIGRKSSVFFFRRNFHWKIKPTLRVHFFGLLILVRIRFFNQVYVM